MRELKPCPFCGNNAELEDLGWPHHVYCTECGAKVTSIKFEEEGEQECVEKWNRRAGKNVITALMDLRDEFVSKTPKSEWYKNKVAQGVEKGIEMAIQRVREAANDSRD